MKCTKCGKHADSEYPDICCECVDPVVDMDTEYICGCGLEPIESDGMCVKCLNDATREGELYEQQVRDDYRRALLGL
jgi:hypothetical protein